MKNWFRFSMLAIQIAGLLTFTQSVAAQPLRKATFELRNELIVQIPDGPSEYGFGRRFLKTTRHSKSKT